MPVPEIHTPREATIVVSASDSASPSGDYFCDGTADEVQINAAINALPATGGKVLLLDGTFTIAAPILVAVTPLIIEGQGSGQHGGTAGATTIQLANSADCNAIQNADTNARNLFVRHLTLAGNKANNASGHGILGDYLSIGGWYKAGIFDVTITSFKNSGVFCNANGVTVTAMAINCDTNDDYGLFYTSGQGHHIMAPNWFNSNGIDGFHVQGQDCDLNVYGENNGRYNVWLGGISRSIATAWSRNCPHQGIYLDTCLESTFRLMSVDSCSNMAGATLPYPADIAIAACQNCSFDIVTSDHSQTETCHGLLLHNSPNNTITGAIKADDYAIHLGFTASPGTLIHDMILQGDAGIFIDNAGSADPVVSNGLVVRNNQGYTAPGDVITIAKIIDHADLTDDAGASGRIDFDDAIPAGSIIKAIKLDFIEAWNSDNTTTLTVMVGPVGDLDAYSLTADPGDNAFNHTTDVYWGESDCQAHRVTAASTPRVTFTEDNDITHIISGAGAQGKLTVYISYMKA